MKTANRKTNEMFWETGRLGVRGGATAVCRLLFLLLFSFLFMERGFSDRTFAEDAENFTNSGEAEGELLPVWDEEKISILANVGEEPIRFWTEMKKGAPRTEWTLPPGGLLSVSNPQETAAVFERAGELIRLRLLQDEIYLFVKQNGIQELLGIGPEYPTSVPTSRIQGKDRENRGGANESRELFLTIPVVVFTDTNIPMAEKPWRERVGARIRAASEILERTCFVKLEIRDFRNWESDPKSRTLRDVMKDFEQKTPLEKGVLAMGFTAHKNIAESQTELGLARQPFYGRILLREEAPQITEAERLETLLHEIGHYLGAVHTSDENSIMRTILHERHARNVKFEIAFDPLNALAMNLWARQFRRGDGERLRTIHPDVCERLEVVYRLIQRLAEEQKAAGVEVLENPNVEFFLRILEKMKKLHSGQSSDSSSEKEPADANAESRGASDESASGKVETGSSDQAVSGKVETGLSDEGSVLSVEKSTSENSSKNETSPKKSTVFRIQSLLKEMSSGKWEPEKTDKQELPVRTARYVLLKTLLSLAQDEPLRGLSTQGKPESDLRGERIVRYAAWAALEAGGTGSADSPAGKAARGAFLLACQIFLEPSGAINKVPIYGRRFRAVETSEIRGIRKELTNGGVSIFGREDHSQHFWLSAALTIQIIPTLVENIGVEKELSDDREGGSGFDATDLNADVAGVWFAYDVMNGKISLEKIGREFEYGKVVPSQIRIPKRRKHPETVEEVQELVLKLRGDVLMHQRDFRDAE